MFLRSTFPSIALFRHFHWRDVAPYWLRVVELNRHRLRSGNANLVYPGEVVELPPL